MNDPASKVASLPEHARLQQRKARLIMLAIVAAFVLPFLVLPLFSSPMHMKKNNKGILIQPHIPFAELALRNGDQPVTASYLASRWTLLYVIPKDCDTVCLLARKHALYAMRQVRLSLDRSVDRVQNLLVFTVEPEAELSALLESEFPGMKKLYGDRQVLDMNLYSRLQEQYPAGNIFLMSPDGYIFMAYPTFADEQESVLRARDIRADLKKSIKGDRQF